MTKLGKHICEILQKEKITIEDFCEESGISKSYYYKIIKDENLSITLSVATSISKALKELPEVLFEEIGVIGIINEYLLTEEQAIHFIKLNEAYFNMCGIEINKLTRSEIYEYVNFIFHCMKMSSYKYK